MTDETVKKIRDALAHGDKVELQPAKDGIIVKRIRRENIGFIRTNEKEAGR